jgi:tetratricopeptide (TPR) repeat protein
MARRLKNRKKDEETLVDIVEVRDTAGDFFERNQKLIIGIVLAAVVIVGGWMVYKNLYQQPKQAEAVEQMYKAQEQFERDSFALALTNPGGGYSGFLDIIDNYKGTPAANMALYYAGISYLNLGKFDAAIDYLKDYNPAGDITPVMKHGAMGDAYSELLDMDNAEKSYKKAISVSNNDFLTAYYLKKLGMFQESQGKIDEALSAYERIKKEFPKSPYGADIDKFIIRANGKKG